VPVQGRTSRTQSIPRGSQPQGRNDPPGPAAPRQRAADDHIPPPVPGRR
jgi:hypothetical protein